MFKRIIISVFLQIATLAYLTHGWTGNQMDVGTASAGSCAGATSGIGGSLTGSSEVGVESGDGSSDGGSNGGGDGSADLFESGIDIPVPVAKAIDPPDATLIGIGSGSDGHFLVKASTTGAGEDSLQCFECVKPGVTVAIANVEDAETVLYFTADESGYFEADVSDLILNDGRNTFSLQTVEGDLNAPETLSGSVPIYSAYDQGTPPVVTGFFPPFRRFSNFITNTSFELSEGDGSSFAINPATGAISFIYQTEVGQPQQAASVPAQGGAPQPLPVSPDVTRVDFQTFSSDGTFMLYLDENLNMHRLMLDTEVDDLLDPADLGYRKFVLCPDDKTVIQLDQPPDHSLGAVVLVDLSLPPGEGNDIIYIQPNMIPTSVACSPDSKKAIVFTTDQMSRKIMEFDLEDPHHPPVIHYETARMINMPVMVDNAQFVYEERLNGGYKQIVLFNLTNDTRMELTDVEMENQNPTITYDKRFVIYERIIPESGTQLFINPFNPDVNVQMTEGVPQFKPVASADEPTVTFMYGFPQNTQVGIFNFEILLRLGDYAP